MNSKILSLDKTDYFKSSELFDILFYLRASTWNIIDEKSRKETIKRLHLLTMDKLGRKNIKLSFNKTNSNSIFSTGVDTNINKVVIVNANSNILDAQIPNFGEILIDYFYNVAKIELFEKANSLSDEEAIRQDLFRIKQASLPTPYGNLAFNKLGYNHELFEFQDNEVKAKQGAAFYLSELIKNNINNSKIKADCEKAAFYHLLVADIEIDANLRREADEIISRNYILGLQEKKEVEELTFKLLKEDISSMNEDSLYLLASGIFDKKLTEVEKVKTIQALVDNYIKKNDLEKLGYTEILYLSSEPLFNNWINNVANIEKDTIIKGFCDDLDKSFVEEYKKTYEIFKRALNDKSLNIDSILYYINPIDLQEMKVYKKEVSKLYKALKNNVKSKRIFEKVYGYHEKSPLNDMEKLSRDYSGKKISDFYKEDISKMIDDTYEKIIKKGKRR